MSLRLLFACILAVTFHSSTSWAWGYRGHWIIALIAYERLSPATRGRIAAILGERGPRAFMYAASPRDLFEANRRWHFVDIPLNAPGYVPGSAYCGDYACAVEKLKELTVAADDQPSFGTKWALQYVVNFAGEIHQPVNVIDAGDDHGERTIVSIGGRRLKLRDLWDRVLVDAEFGSDAKAAAAKLTKEITDADRQAWCAGTPDDWTSETFLIARDFVYSRSGGPSTHDKPIALASSYEAEARAIVREQVKKAGVRLACWLDAHLD